MNLIKKLCLDLFILCGVFTFVSFTVFAQSDPKGEKRVTGTYAITNATVYTSPGLSNKATVIIKNGLIQEVGNNIKIPVEAKEISGDSLFVYAGFIDVASDAGVSKPASPERPQEFDPSNPPPHIAGITPYREVLDDFNFESEKVSEWREEGFTMAQLLPKGDGMLPGKTSIVIYGQKGSSNIIAVSTGILAKFQTVSGMYPGTTLGIMAKWRNLFENAELAARHQMIFANNTGVIRPEKDQVLESFFPVINKTIPVIFEVSDELETRRALTLQREKGFNMILTGINDGATLIPEIKEANVQVVLSLDLPEDKATKKKLEGASEDALKRLERVKEAYKNSLELASEFEKEGIPFAFATNSSKTGHFMKNIHLMLEHGLSEEAALAALTINAAKILRMDKIAGSIEKGKLANLVLTTDSLFKKGSQVKYVFADGYLFDYEINKKDDNEGEDDLSGSWNYITETPEGSSSGVMKLKKKSDGYEGTITYDDPEGGGKKPTEMSNIERSGNTLKFNFNVDVQGTNISVSVSGDFSGTEYEGQLTITDFGSFPFKASKSPDSIDNI